MRDTRRYRLPALLTASAAALLSCATLVAAPARAAEPSCPDIHVLAVQGTSQSSSNAPTKVDQGMLSSVIRPVLGAAATDKTLRVDRTYVPYRANFGNRNGVTSDYRDSATQGLNRLSQLANRIVLQCPATKLVVLGYSQGGHVVDAFASSVAAGQGSVAPESIAFVATYGSPTRASGAALFPNSPGQVAPRGLPGIGDLKPTKFADQLTTSQGQGIGPDVDQISDFGALNGRVADFCIDGDLACSSPRSASLLRLGANIVEQSNLDFADDPTGTAARLAAAVADTAVRGTSTVVNADLSGSSLADLAVNPNLSISQRLSEVSSPRSLSSELDSAQAGQTQAPAATPTGTAPGLTLPGIGLPTGSATGPTTVPGPTLGATPTAPSGGGLGSILSQEQGQTSTSPSTATAAPNTGSGTGAAANGTGQSAPAPTGADNPLRAIAKLGTIALNTVGTFATAMLTPENIASMVTAGVSAAAASSGNPVAAASGAASGTQLASAAMNAGLQAIPPATAISGVKSIFQTLLNEVSANADLPQLVFDARTWNQVAYHGGYTNSPVSSTGAAATEVTANWIITAARAYAKVRQDANKPTPEPKSGTTSPTAPYRTTTAGDTAPAGAIQVNTAPVTKTNDHVLLAANTKPAAATPTPTGTTKKGGSTTDTIPVAVDNPSLTEAQRIEVASDPEFVDPNQVQRLARYGTIALSSQQVSLV